MSGEKKNSTLVILNVVQLIVILVLAFLLYTKTDENTQLTETVSAKNEEIVSQKNELLTLKDDLVKIKEERERLGLSNDSLNEQIAQLDTYMKELEKQNSYNASERRRLSKFVDQLKADVAAKEEQITKLVAANDSLSTSVDSLSKQNTQMSDSMTNLATEREHLQKDLAYASILDVSETLVAGLKENGKELDQPFSGKRLSQVRMNFTLADNKAAEHDKKRFYLRMILPSGECFSDKRNGGGTFTDHEGTEMKYTMHKDIEFANSHQTVSFIMPKGFNYTEGNYILQVYCEGYDIGQSSFIVK